MFVRSLLVAALAALSVTTSVAQAQSSSSADSARAQEERDVGISLRKYFTGKMNEDDTKAFSRSIGETATKQAHPTGKNVTVESSRMKIDRVKKRTTVTMNVAYYGELTGKKYTGTVTLVADISNPLFIETEELSFSDDNNWIPANQEKLASYRAILTKMTNR